MKNLDEFKAELVKSGHITGKVYKCPKCGELMFSLASPGACPFCQAEMNSGTDYSVFDFEKKTAKAEVVTALKVIDREEAEEFVDVLENPYAPKEDVDAAMEKLVKPVSSWENSYEPRYSTATPDKKKGKK